MTTLDTVVQTQQGALRGQSANGVVAFKGVPYAAAPFGALRFAPPQRPERWAGVRDALAFGPTAPHAGYAPPYDVLLPDPVLPGEDCLNLNVWTPEPGAAGLPVMVWIHGGAFVNGSGAVPTYDGSAFARDGVVLVTINYRLGAEGFLWLEDGVNNRGLLDQLAALEWVQDNVAAFGGDPANVTVFGESAGAMSIGALLATPRSDGLFRRAILQSGAGHHAIAPATARLVAAEVGTRLGVEPSAADAFAAIAPGALLAAQGAVMQDAQLDPDPARWGEIAANMMVFEPVVDGELLTDLPIRRLAAGAAAGVDLLAGTTTDEHRLFLVPTGVADATTAEALPVVAAMYGLDPATALAAYRAARPAGSPGELLSDVLTDWFFRVPAIRVSEARAVAGTGRSWQYEFAWRSPQLGGRLGACHAIEVPFAFDTLADESGVALLGDRPPQQLADEVHGAWVAFAATGDPGWAPYEPGRRHVMRFDESSAVVEDPDAGRRAVWDGLR
jgi:para-nitrobenzyl esterase